MNSKKLPSLNKILLIGNLTKDPELRYTHKGIPVINFRIASSRRFKDNSGEWKEDVCYIGVVAWQKLAENCGEYLKKGSTVFIEGELQSRAWENDDGARRSAVEIHAQRIQFLDRRKTMIDAGEETAECVEKEEDFLDEEGEE
jgi:single-strand DNA-binding protein